MSVAELLSTHTSAELTDWMAYERVTGPLGGERLDALVAVLAATVANTARGKGRKAKPADFMPEWDAQAEMDWHSMLTAVKSMNRRLGGVDLTERGDDGTAGRAPGRDRHQHGGPDYWRERRR